MLLLGWWVWNEKKKKLIEAVTCSFAYENVVIVAGLNPKFAADYNNCWPQSKIKLLIKNTK